MTKPPSGGSAVPTQQPQNPRGELDTALAAARLSSPLVTGRDDRLFAVLPDSFSLHELPCPDAMPPFIKQRLTVDEAMSLATYANRFSTPASILVADIDQLAVQACLDWHEDNEQDEPLQPGPRRHTATLQLRESEEFKRWNEIEGQLIDQMAFAEFLDENAADIVDPAPATMIEIARDLEATQGVNFKSSTRLQTGERSITYETETHTKGEMKVPTQFTLQIPLFVGEAPIDIVASFRFRPRPDGLKLGFVWRRVEYRKQAEFQSIATRVAEATGLPVIFGRVAP